MSMDPMWERLGRTRAMARIITAVEAWFERMHRRDIERLRTRREPPTPGHEQTHQLVWTHPSSTLYRLVTIDRWTRNGSTPATCVACRNQFGLALTWLSGYEHLARFQCCECGASWCDPLWASSAATEYVLGNSHDLEWADPAVWFSETDRDLTVTHMRYEAEDENRRRDDGDQ